MIGIKVGPFVVDPCPRCGGWDLSLGKRKTKVYGVQFHVTCKYCTHKSLWSIPRFVEWCWNLRDKGSSPRVGVF